MPGTSDIELLLCTIFNVKSTRPLTKEADVKCMGPILWANRSLTHLLVTFPLETRDSRIVFLHSSQLIRLVKDTSSFNQL